MQPKTAVSKATKVGVIHNPNHKLHYCERQHPEKPERLDAIIKQLETSKLIKNCNFINEYSSNREHLTLAHREEYIKLIESFSTNEEGDSYYTPDTHKVAESAVSGACLAVDKAFAGEFQHAFCLVRPPGHHANMSEEKMTGFCAYNNVAIANLYARKAHGVKKALIFDWDVHHGDGTEKIFYSDPDTLFISIHKFQTGWFYPGGSGDIEKLGEGPGLGYSINCPWNVDERAGLSKIVGDNEYVYLFEAVLWPIIVAYQPEIVFVSAGFDSANGDPLGGLAISAYCYSYILKRLMSLEKKVIVCLEGGYNPEVNADCVEYCTRTLLGEKSPVKGGSERWTIENMKKKPLPNKIALELVESLLKYLETYWPCVNEKKYVDYRNEIKENMKKYYVKDVIFPAGQDIELDKGKITKKVSIEESLLLKGINNANSKTFLNNMKIIQEYLPKEEKVIRKIGLKQALCSYTYRFDWEKFNNVSYFIMKLGFNDMKNDKQIYWSKNSRIKKVVFRNDKNEIIEKWDESVNYGLNYDMAITDPQHDRLILFLRFFLMSHGAEMANLKAFEYFQAFLERLEEWMSKENKVEFSSLTFIFMVDNKKELYRIGILKFEDVNFIQKEKNVSEDGVYKTVKELKEMVKEKEDFVRQKELMSGCSIF